MVVSASSETNTGLVGWFDILGYEQIQENNDLPYTIGLLTNTLGKAEPFAREKIDRVAKAFPSQSKAKVLLDRFLETIPCVVFADTIVLAVPLPRRTTSTTYIATVGAFLAIANAYLKSFLDEGLPLRAAISYGDYYINVSERNFLIAGKPIVRAHRIAESQEWSGCVLHPSVQSILEQTMEKSFEPLRRQIWGFLTRYPVPIKDKPVKQITTKEMVCLNWPQDANDSVTKESIPGLISRKFSEHNKDISKPDTQLKIKNTADFWIQNVNHKVPNDNGK